MVYAGLEKYRNEANLIDILFRTLVDPKMYDFKQVWERKIPPIALSGVKLLSGCRWVADLAKCNTWDEALAMVDSVFERCRPSEVAKDVKYVVRAFLHTGKFQWKTAQSYIDSVMQFSVFPMVLKLEELRANMITEILKPSTSYRGQGPPNLEVLRRQANQAASRASEPLRTPQTPVVVTSPKVTKPPSQEKRVEAPVTSSASSLGLSTSSSATNLSRPENQENVKPARPSKETQGDRMVGKKAEIEFHKFLWAKDWWRAREAFKVAGYNLYFADVQTLQADWDKVLGWRGRANDLSLDPVIMRFGWRTEFARAQEGHWTKEREAMDQIRNNPLINPSEVLDRLKLGTLIDPRPDQCEKMLDVAKLFARTGKFHRGLQIARAECDDDLEVEDEAGILQAFVEGLYDETRGVDHRAEIANALRYVIEDFEKSTKDWRWGAAALSLRQALLSGGDDDDGLFAPLRPLPVTQLRGGSRFLLLKKKDITVDDINKAIDNDRSPPKDLVNYIPVIKEIFNAQKGNGLNALYLVSTTCVLHYLTGL